MEELKKALLRGRVVIVAGAGVSTAAAHLPGWRGALESAIDYLKDVGTVQSERIEALHVHLQEAESPQDLIACANDAKTLLIGSSSHSGEFATWLKDTFDVPAADVRDPALLRAIHALGASLLTTTNFDKLLSSSQLGLESITWREPHLLSLALQDGQRVVHLHGVWDEPGSVVFGAEDYDELLANAARRTFLRTLWLDRTLLFIGCSFDGMQDPDFLALLQWASKAFPHTAAKHFALVRSDTYTAVQADEFLNRWRIQLLPYGSSHDDLVPVLETLRPPEPSSLPLTPSVIVGRQSLVEEACDVVAEKRALLLYGMGGIGKTTVAAAVCALVRTEHPTADIIWLDGKGKRLIDLYRDIGTRTNLPEAQFLSEQDILTHIPFALSQLEHPMVVVDDATDAEAAQQLAHQLSSINVGAIVTARTRVSGFGAYKRVAPLDEASAEELFSQVSGVSRDEPLVRRICSLLEGHPLAITLAAGRHAVEDMPLQRLFARLSEEKARLDTLCDPDQPESASCSVRASLTISMENMPPHVERTLATLSYFDADPSLDLLAAALDLGLNECEDRVGRLVTRSLAQRNRVGSPNLHALTRTAARERFANSAPELRAMVDSAIVSLLRGLDQDLLQTQRKLLQDLECVIAFIKNTSPDGFPVRQQIAVELIFILCNPHGLLHRFSLTEYYFAAAEEILDLGRRLAENLGDPILVVRILSYQANLLTYRHRHQEALAILESGRSIATATDDRELTASIKCQLGNTLLELNHYPEAEAIMRDGLSDAIASTQSTTIAQLTGQLGRVLLGSRKLDEAEAYYTEAKQQYEELADPLGVAACAYHLSTIAKAKGLSERSWELQIESLDADISGDNYDGALSSLERLASGIETEDQLAYVLDRIIRLIEELPPEVLIAHSGIGESLKSSAYLQLGQFDRAKEFLLASLAARQQYGDIRGTAVCWGNLASIAHHQADFVMAQEYNQKSMTAYEATGNPVGIATCCNNGIPIAVGLGDIDAAIGYACTAIYISALRGDLVGVARAFGLLWQNVLPHVADPPQILFPVGEHTFPSLMRIVAGAARARDIGRVIGATVTLMSHYGPGGIPNGVADEKHENEETG